MLTLCLRLNVYQTKNSKIKHANLRVPVHMHMKHQLAKRGAQKVRKSVVLHTPMMKMRSIGLFQRGDVCAVLTCVAENIPT